MSYKHHINSHFGSCRLLAETLDKHRNRKVKLFMMPGEFNHVGVSDGTDAWIAPAISTVFAVDVCAILAKIREGQDVPVQRDLFVEEQPGRQRRRLAQTEPQPTVPTRRRLTA